MFKPTNAFELYWYFVSERHAMLERRLAGKPREEWTADPNLALYRFTNVYRVEDYVSQYLLRNVLYEVNSNDGVSRTGKSYSTVTTQACLNRKEPHDPASIFFRVMLFKLFNKPETWEQLNAAGLTNWNDRPLLDAVDRKLTLLRNQRVPIYSAAYVMPAAHANAVSKHRTHLELLWRMMREGLPEKLAGCTTFSKALATLQQYPIMGDFLASQYLLDLDYSEAFNFEQDMFPAGPGARSGMVKCFPFNAYLTGRGYSAAYRSQAFVDIIQDMQANQAAHLRTLGLPFNRLYGLPLALNDIQNCFCETDKLARVALPAVKGIGGRTNVKQKFTPRGGSWVDIVVPPKWLRKRHG